MINIRRECEADRETVYELVKAAFASAEHSDGNEHDLVNALREGESFIPELSLVAEQDGQIVGYILFTKLKLGSAKLLALAPLAVLAEYQRTGVGTALIARAHEIARELGYEYSVVLGSEKYYPRSGYVPASSYGIAAPFEVNDENFMAIKLDPEAPPVSGTVEYAPEFGL